MDHNLEKGIPSNPGESVLIEDVAAEARVASRLALENKLGGCSSPNEDIQKSSQNITESHATGILPDSLVDETTPSHKASGVDEITQLLAERNASSAPDEKSFTNTRTLLSEITCDPAVESSPNQGTENVPSRPVEEPDHSIQSPADTISPKGLDKDHIRTMRSLLNEIINQSIKSDAKASPATSESSDPSYIGVVRHLVNQKVQRERYYAKEGKLLNTFFSETPYAFFSDWEQPIGFLHLINTRYARAKVLKHASIFFAATKGVNNELPEQVSSVEAAFKSSCTLERFDCLHDNLTRYYVALSNFNAWRKSMNDPAERVFLPLDMSEEFLAAADLLDRDPRISQAEKRENEEMIVEGFLTFNDDRSAVWLTENTKMWKEGNIKSKKAHMFFSRLAMALFGGIALIAPMLVMTLHPGRVPSLVTTSVFVVVVAIILAWWMEDAQNKDIIAATAGYAAVLVVFVGVGTPTTG